MRFSRKQGMVAATLVVCAAALVAVMAKWGLEAFSFFADGDKLQAWIEAQRAARASVHGVARRRPSRRHRAAGRAARAGRGVRVRVLGGDGPVPLGTRWARWPS